MNRTASKLFTGLLSLALCTTAFAAEEGWTVDFEAAKTTAASEKKDLFLEFTGSDWCPPCKKMKADVFDKEAFKTGAPPHFVLVKLDFPQDKSKQTKEEIAQNRSLQKQYQITGFPTVIFADAQGRPYARTVGFAGVTAEVYVQQMIEFRKVRESRDAAFALADKAEGIEKAKLLDKGLSGMDADLLASVYKPEVDQIIAADADGKAGLKAKYESMLQLPVIVKALQEIQQEEGDVDGRLKKIDDLVAKMKATGQALQEAHFTKAIVVYSGGDKDGAKVHMEAAIEAAPTSRKADQIRTIMARVYSGAAK